MADNNLNPLSSNEYGAIGKAIFDMVAGRPGNPADIEYDYQDIRGSRHIGIGTDPGGKYTKEDVTGGFEAKVPFSIVYQVKATTNLQHLTAEELLNDIADYLENMDYPALTDSRRIIKITMNSTTYRASGTEDGTIQYRRSGVLMYEKE